MANANIFFGYLWLLLSLHICQGRPSWCVAKAKGKVGNLELSSYVRSTCRKNPVQCRIIQPGGACFDGYSDMVTRTQSQASFLLNRIYAETKVCNKNYGEIIYHYPPRTTIGRISFSWLCFASVNS